MHTRTVELVRERWLTVMRTGGMIVCCCVQGVEGVEGVERFCVKGEVLKRASLSTSLGDAGRIFNGLVSDETTSISAKLNGGEDKEFTA